MSSRYLHDLTKPDNQNLEDIEELDEEEETSWQDGNGEPEQSEDVGKVENSEPEFKPTEVLANLIVGKSDMEWMRL